MLEAMPTVLIEQKPFCDFNQANFESNSLKGAFKSAAESQKNEASQDTVLMDQPQATMAPRTSPSKKGPKFPIEEEKIPGVEEQEGHGISVF
mmetsp:Transcript_38737/g.58917  ORF Transcript_38737/g.58917 Transcript_38737/m.58917 type:complete len:92 (+) Transcript_38737:1472-1747(+)